MEDPTKKNIELSPEESRAESLRLRALMDKRSEDALRAAERMWKRPLSSEQLREQVKEAWAAQGLKYDGKILPPGKRGLQGDAP